MPVSPLIWAHRGASVTERENTVAAFREACRVGADGIELDVRRAGDESLVVHHDAVLADGRAVVGLTQAELPTDVPLLDAALDACGELLVNIEIKNVEGDSDHDPTEQLAAAVVAVVQARDAYDSVLVSSFSLPTVNRVRELDPRIMCGYLTSPRSDQIEALQKAIASGHVAIHPHHTTVNAELVARAHDANLAVNTWTVDDPDRMRWLADVGVDAIVTNVPDVALATFNRPVGPA